MGERSSVRFFPFRKHENNSSNEQVQQTIQFDEGSSEYRCLCSCFHVKTGAFVIASVHIVMIIFFFVHSLLVYLQHDGRFQEARGVKENYVFGSFIAELIGLGIASFTVLLMLIGLSRHQSLLLIPHLIIQAISVVLFALLVIAGIIAVTTDLAVFYRLINAAPFVEHPSYSTVGLDGGTMLRIYFLLTLYGISFFLEIWFITIIYSCVRYLDERSTYMKYCLAFSTPMKRLSER